MSCLIWLQVATGSCIHQCHRPMVFPLKMSFPFHVGHSSSFKHLSSLSVPAANMLHW